MKILLTGASGFLGSSIKLSLNKAHKVITLGIEPSNDVVADITQNIQPVTGADIVVHCAGKAHMVPKTQQEIDAFYSVNLQGTINLLSALNSNPPRTFVFISTVAVYGVDAGKNISEDHPLKGNTPYALSKIKAEEEVRTWCNKHNVTAVILRLPLISGPTPPGNLGAMIKAFTKGYYFRIGQGQAQKSVVGVKDIAALIPTLLSKSGTFNLTDGIHPSIKQIDNHIASMHSKKNVKTLPVFVLRVAASIGDVFGFFPFNSDKLNKLISSLTFNDDKARKQLGWNPEPALNSLTLT